VVAADAEISFVGVEESPAPPSPLKPVLELKQVIREESSRWLVTLMDDPTLDTFSESGKISTPHCYISQSSKLHA
jgi:hypothetical protein